MANPLTPKRKKLRDFLHSYTEANGCAPTYKEMAEYMDVSIPSIHEMVRGMKRAGLVTQRPFLARSVRVTTQPDPFAEAEVVKPGDDNGKERLMRIERDIWRGLYLGSLGHELRRILKDTVREASWRRYHEETKGGT